MNLAIGERRRLRKQLKRMVIPACYLAVKSHDRCFADIPKRTGWRGDALWTIK